MKQNPQEKNPKQPVWSVTRIKHPKYPDLGCVRVAEFPTRGDSLYLFRNEGGRQKMYALGKACGLPQQFRADLGRTATEQVDAAKRLAAEFIEREMTQQPAITTSAMLTWTQLADRYESAGFAGRTENYKRDALAAVRRFAAFVGADQRVGDLKPTEVANYIAHRRAQGRRDAGRGDVDAVKICCNWGVEMAEILDLSPFTRPGFKKVMPPKPTRRRPVATRERYEKLKKVAGNLPPAFEVLLDMANHGGHRIGGICRLRWDDVLFDDGKIRWYSGVRPDRKKHEHDSWMNPVVQTVLRQWQKRTRGIGQTFLFPSPTDPTKPVGYHVVKKWLRQAEWKAKLTHEKQGGWHMFRRKWATDRKGNPVQDVAVEGGWGKDSASLRECYQHADEETRRVVGTFVA